MRPEVLDIFTTDDTDELAYLEVVRALPRPTDAQCAAFAEHVASAHSWYKHLPLHPRSTVSVLLDPHVGMAIEQDGGLRPATEKDCWHYSMLPTPEYRTRYGHLSYRVKKPHEEKSIKLDVFGSAGELIVVPESLLTRWEAHVNSLVHPHPPTLKVQRKLSHYLRPGEWEGWADDEGVDRTDIMALLQRHQASRAEQLGRLRTALRTMVEDVFGASG